jgi:hypothetical protein
LNTEKNGLYSVLEKSGYGIIVPISLEIKTSRVCLGYDVVATT